MLFGFTSRSRDVTWVLHRAAICGQNCEACTEELPSQARHAEQRTDAPVVYPEREILNLVTHFILEENVSKAGSSHSCVAAKKIRK